MIVSGLLVTLSGISDRSIVVGSMRSRAELTVGELHDRWLPVALEACDDAQSRELHDWIGAQPGVEFVDVVSVSFDDSEPGGVGDRSHPVESSKPSRLVEDDASELAPVPVSALND